MSNQQGFGPALSGPGPHPTPRRDTVLIVSVAAAAVAVLTVLVLALWNFVLDPVEVGGGPSPTPGVTTPTTTEPPPSTTQPPPTTEPPATTQPPPPPPPPPPPEFPVGSRPCPGVYPPVGGFTSSAIGNDVTSCPFAEEVRLAYAQQPARDRAVVVDAFSPVTGITYTMTCQGGRLVTCTGGNNAVVHLL